MQYTAALYSQHAPADGPSGPVFAPPATEAKWPRGPVPPRLGSPSILDSEAQCSVGSTSIWGPSGSVLEAPACWALWPRVGPTSIFGAVA